MESKQDQGMGVRHPVAILPSREPLASPADVARDYGVPETTQAVWRCVDRYGFRSLVIKVGRSVRYRRDELERWLESRRLVVDDELRANPSRSREVA